MDRREQLLRRLDDIGRSLERTGQALALIGLGSVGRELERLDRYSDLDFFAIVEPGSKQRFIDNLDWLSSIRPIAYCFRNTEDGYKLLFDDAVFCEFAVFEPAQLARVPFAPGRIVWKRAGVDEAIGTPAIGPPAPAQAPVEWLVGEALTNLYVGLCRYRRGELLSAARFVQVHAVDRVLDLARLTTPDAAVGRDAFAADRRAEQRFPALAGALPEFVQGYGRSPQSAAAILRFLEAQFEVNPAMARAVRSLIES